MIQKIKLELAITALIVGLIVVLTSCTTVSAGNKLPQTDADFGKSSVSITLTEKRSGGSGVILRSTAAESIILTNKHVCNLVQQGGVVNNDQGTYPITAYKIYPKHDLCLVKVQADLHYRSKVAQQAPTEFDSMVIAGHPALLPTLITKGHFAKHMNIQVMVDAEKCTGEEEGQEQMFCALFGMKPIIKDFEAQSTSGLIMPGSSGSGVFNAKGELSGLVFAGPGEGLGFGFIVPYEYVLDFLKNAYQYKWVQPSVDTPRHSLFKDVAAMERLCGSVEGHCGVQSHGIYGY